PAQSPCEARAVRRILPSELRRNRASRFPCPKEDRALSLCTREKSRRTASGILLRSVQCRYGCTEQGIHPALQPTLRPWLARTERARNATFASPTCGEQALRNRTGGRKG